MKFSFKDIYNEELYKTGYVVFIASQYNIFNNIVVDNLKETTRPKAGVVDDTSLMEEFGINSQDKTNDSLASTTVDFNTFMDIINTPSVNGKWFCSVDLELMSAKQLEKFNRYIRNPNSNGVLVVKALNYKDFRLYLNNKAFTLGKNSHLIQLGFPYRAILEEIVIDLFKQRKVTIDKRSSELFVMRMSSSYDDYTDIIDKISIGYENNTLSYEQMEQGLKGIENYVLDDLLEKLLSPIKGDKIKLNRSVYKMLKSLLKEMGASELVSKLKYKVDDYIEFRIAINRGIIPIKVKYSVAEAKDKLGERSKIAKITDFRFRKMAQVASLTSLKDWTYLKLLLNSVSNRDSEISSERVLYTIVHRTVFSQSRLNNDLGIENIIEDSLNKINKIKYTEENLMLQLESLD